MSGVDRLVLRRLSGLPTFNLGSIGLAGVVILAEVSFLLLAALASGVIYHQLAYGGWGAVRTFGAIGCLVALLYVLPHLSQGNYSLASYIAGRWTGRSVVVRWHATLLLLALVGFLTKTTAMFSRGWMVLFYVVGLVGLVALNAGVTRLVRSGAEKGRILGRRVMLVGASKDIALYWERLGRGQPVDRVVSIARLPEMSTTAQGAVRQETLDEVLRSAVEHARIFGVEAVLILPGEASHRVIARCVGVLSTLPVSIHLDAGPALDSVPTTEVQRIGQLAALTLAEQPLGPLQSFVKRGFDIAAALFGLILLSPLFLVLALLIKLDSKGPVFFRQRRRGYNQREFRILKFRSMTTLDDGDVVRQATVGDARITRMGRILRKTNLDELPQLWNVLVGDMSLVGPRPHAVAHDQAFEKRIGHYPRRLNVKPGITGWAQVNGLRGETDTDDKMARRVEYDLHYIDNWSIWLDFYIVFLTIVSRRAYRNAR